MSTSIEVVRPANESLFEYLTFDGVINRAIVLYTGRHKPIRTQSSLSTPAALVCGGILFYLDILREVTDYPCQAIKLHIIPGRIEVDSGRNFDTLSDFHGPGCGESRGYQSVIAEKPTDLTHQQFVINNMLVTPKIDLKLIIEETLNSLTAYYALNVQDSGYYTFGPYLMMEHIIQSTGFVNCTRQRCPKPETKYPTMVRLTGDNQASINATTISGHDLILRRVSSNPILRCMALLLNDALSLQDLGMCSSGHRNVNNLNKNAHERQEVEAETNSGSDSGDTNTEADSKDQINILSILQGDECMPCCIQAAIRYREDKTIAQIIEA
ncbi:MAG: hypothetical protein Q9187_007154 [Circinaria calcarea]